ncbi:dienelactone hydrolase [Dipodascopsis uninucleata]
MASNVPGDCCLTGIEHDGKPLGSISVEDGIETYFAISKEPTTKVILYITDIFGMPFNNHKLLADRFAKCGYTTVIPNLFGDDAIPSPRPADFDFAGWRERHGIDEISKILTSTIDVIKKKFPEMKQLFGTGYCFGAKYVVRLMGEEILAAGFIAHPSFVSEDEVKAMKGPLSIAAAETDAIFPKEKRHLTEDILTEKKDTYMITLYSQVSHGFATRGNLDNATAKWSMEAAFNQAVAWFNRFSN